MAENETNGVSGWTGWITFAVIILVMEGIFHFMAGFVALFQEDVYKVAAGNVWVFDYSAWGWIHIIGGALALLAAGSLMKGNMFGRIFAVLVAVLSATANMAFVPVYPIWSLTMVAVCFLIIWAVIVHGKDVKALATEV